MVCERTRWQQSQAVLFSAAEPYLDAAATALRRQFAAVQVDLLGPDVGRLEAADIDAGGVAAVCRSVPIPFVRHLANESVRLPSGTLDQAAEAAVEATQAVGDAPAAGVALQVWASGAVGVRAEAVRADVDAALDQAGVATARGECSRVLGVCMTPAGVSLGITPTSDALADWPGGRVILARRPQQVSRAEWKLEELFKVFDGPLPSSSGCALDLGASPGGWTRILRTHGYEVWAVDPGELDQRVAADPGVHHVTTTAGQFLSGEGPSSTDDGGPQHFDVIVNDMRMVAERSSRVMLDAADCLMAGGVIIMTLKVSRRGASRTIERALGILGRRYRPVFVRQLFHNKNEVTVVAHRR